MQIRQEPINGNIAPIYGIASNHLYKLYLSGNQSQRKLIAIYSQSEAIAIHNISLARCLLARPLCDLQRIFTPHVR
jgi:hypothetical protein